MRTAEEVQAKLDEVRDAISDGEISERLGEAIEDALSWVLGDHDDDPLQAARPLTYRQVANRIRHAQNNVPEGFTIP